MDRFEDFCRSVLKSATRATGDEQAEISRELTAHMEDHYDALIERGVPPDEAVQRSVSEMGDPEELGRQLNATLNPFWLILGRLCVIASTLIIIGALLPSLAGLYTVWNNIEARFADSGDFNSRNDQEIVYTDCDIEFEVEGHIIRIVRYGTAISQDGDYGVHIDALAYTKNPFEHCNSNLLYNIEIYGMDRTSGGGHSTAGGAYWDSFTPLAKGTDTAILTFDLYSYHYETVLTLDWGDAA
ncbi:MAG: permease prefix domain 1-containing protein [Candidatus Heteroscillospira sp.]|jgi:hypothetical protein